jgi:vacuolar-type H+-ATPase subunit C/Vma6
MSRASRYAFIHAKVCGAMARAVAGEAYRDLLRLKSLTELSDRLFPEEASSRKDRPLPADLEARIMQAAVHSMTTVLRLLRTPPPLLVHAARRVEYRTVKALLRALAHGRREEVRIWDLGPWSGFRRPDPKDPQKTLRSSLYAWVLPLAGTVPDVELENRLDRDYHDRLFDLAGSLPAADRMPVMRLLRAEAALENAVRALRLRFFFKLDAQLARPLMIPGSSSTVTAALEEAFEIAADSSEDWRRWRFAALLEDQLGESFEAPDPVRAEQRASRLLYVRAHRAFHQHPFTLGPLVAYFRLKEHEASLLSIATEALHLGVPESDVLAITGEG